MKLWNYAIAILLFMLFLKCGESTSSKNFDRFDGKSKNFKEDIKGTWIGVHGTSYSPKGKVINSDPITGLVLLEFRDSTFKRKTTRDNNSYRSDDSGMYKTEQDTITLISSKRGQSNFIFTLNNKSLTLESAHYMITGHSETNYKKMNFYNQSYNFHKVREFLTNSSIEIKELTCTRKECECKKRYEFYQNGFRDESYDCFEINWYSNTWELDSLEYKGELFLKMSDFNQPIQIKEVFGDTIIGVRYRIEDTEVTIQKAPLLFKTDNLIGKWKILNYVEKKGVKEIEITKNNFIEKYENGKSVSYFWSNSSSNEFLYIDEIFSKINGRSRRNSFLIGRLSKVDKNYIKMAMQETAKNQWYHIEMQRVEN